MNNDLIERYIYAVTRNLPKKMKDDIEKELSGLIDDMLDERCGELPPTEKDIRVVLTELGNPTELAAKYSPDKDACLIGPPYYTQFKKILVIVLVCVFAGITIGLTMDFALSEEKVHWIFAFSEWFAAIISSGLQAFAILTLIFAFFQKKAVKLNEGYSMDNLPSVPKKEENVSKSGAVMGIVLAVLFGVIFTVAPQVCCAFSISDSGAVTSFPVFDADVIHSMWYIVIAFTVVGIVKSLVELFEGRYTMRLMWTAIGANVISAILTVIFFGSDKIVHPEFVGGMQKLFGEEGQFIVDICANFNYFFIGIIIFALVLDTATVVVKSIKYAEK